jgi:BirA family biotin operon repressor/biotin-[acetyl-CoA-carboxylase] ligase
MALLLSVLFRPPSSPFSEAGTLPVRVGLALARVLCSTAGEIITLKWPNDLLAGKDKLAGILCEAAGDFLVVGIGVNVLQQAADFPPEIRGQATSLRLVTGSIGSRASLAGAILDELRMWFERASGPLTPAELERFAALDALAGSQVVIDGKQPGVARGIDRSGALLLETAGRLRTVHAGTVRKAP